MMLYELPEGTEVDICISSGVEKRSIRTKIEKVKDKVVLLEAIKADGKLVGFNGMQPEIFYIEDKKPNLFSGVKIAPVKFGGNIYHAAECPNPSTFFNRRAAFRVYLGKEMYVTNFTSNGPQSVEALIKDISEKGFAFINKESYELNDLIRLQLEIEEGKILKLSARVVRIDGSRGGGEILYGCELQERNQLLGNFIMKYQQEKQRNKIDGKRAED